MADLNNIQFSVRPPSRNYIDWMVVARTKDDSLRGPMPGGFSFPFRDSRMVGAMGIDPKTGVINEMAVADHLQRQGIATQMLETARKMHSAIPKRFPEPRHGEWRTHEGDAWARAVGGELPPNQYYEGE